MLEIMQIYLLLVIVYTKHEHKFLIVFYIMYLRGIFLNDLLVYYFGRLSKEKKNYVKILEFHVTPSLWKKVTFRAIRLCLFKWKAFFRHKST